MSIATQLRRAIRSAWGFVNFAEMEVLAGSLATDETGRLLDVGAHFGTSSRPFLQRGWSVDAFEPDPKNLSHLKQLQQRFPSRLNIHEMAVSDSSGDLVNLYGSTVSTGISSLHDFHESHEVVATATTTTLKDFLASHPQPRVDLLKIDVEGHEVAVFDGMDTEQNKPRAIMVEFDETKELAKPPTARALANRLSDWGYEVVVCEWDPITVYGARHRPAGVHQSVADIHPESWGNLIGFIDPTDASEFRSAAASVAARARRLHPLTSRLARAINLFR